MASRTKAVRKTMSTRMRPGRGSRPTATPDEALALLFDHTRKTTSKANAGAAKASVAATLKPKHIAANLSFCGLNDSTDSSNSSSAHIQQARACSKRLFGFLLFVRLWARRNPRLARNFLKATVWLLAQRREPDDKGTAP